MASQEFLSLCESFYSVQGEGLSVGQPAVFLRLSGCNLRCNGFTYRDPHTHEHLGCDTKQLWREGRRTHLDVILPLWQTNGWLAHLNAGAHLVITGGEPVLQQGAVMHFLNRLDAACKNHIYLEMETNATLLLEPALLTRLDQINASPKLIHSGETREKAYNIEVLAQLAGTPKTVFKFVVAEPSDIEEIIRDYVSPFAINPRRIWLMPEGGTQESINQKKPWLVELCKQHCFNFTTRLHIDIWGEVVGV